MPEIELPPPTGGEVDVLAVLWGLKEGEAMKLSQIHERVSERRRKDGDEVPALTTVSTHLRSAVAKGLLREVRLNSAGEVQERPKRTLRGALAATRSPQTAYQPAHPPGVVFRYTFRAIAAAYPDESPAPVLLDCARALGVPAATITRIEELLSKK